MTTSNTMQMSPTRTNGVDVDQVLNVIGKIEEDPDFGKFQFRAKNQWIDGGLNRSQIKDFFAGGEEDKTRTTTFTLDAGEPAILDGDDSAPNPVEFVLHALAGCLTTTLVYHAAVQGIEIEGVESTLDGDIDLRGLFGMSDEVRKGYNRVRVKMRVKSAADKETLTALAMHSPVYDIVSQSLPVEFELETY